MAAKTSSTAAPSKSAAIAPHYCMSEENQFALKDLRGALEAVAVLLDNPDVETCNTDMACLMRTFGRAAGTIVEASPFLHRDALSRAVN